MSTVRPPAVAGRFYPADPAELEAEVRRCLAEGREVVGLPAEGRPAGSRAPPPVHALVAPHAGYVFSGPVAGTAYAAVERGLASRSGGSWPRRVVLVGPAHYVAVRGVAVATADAFGTPLGELRVDRSGVARALEVAGVTPDDDAHAPEHALETHLPFLRVVLGDVPIVPLLAGLTEPSVVSEVLDALAGDGDALVVVSSDLSHYLPHDEARARDAATARAVEALDAGGVGPDDACGFVPLRGLLESARRRGLAARALDLRTSADTGGPRDRVVGYGAFAFTGPGAALGEEGSRA